MRGQISLEAMLAISAFLLIASAAIALLSAQKQSSAEFLSLEKAKTVSIECAMMVNAVFSNTARIISKKEMNCASEGNRVKSTVEEKSKTSRTIASELATNRVNGKDFLEVKMLGHYR